MPDTTPAVCPTCNGSGKRHTGIMVGGLIPSGDAGIGMGAHELLQTCGICLGSGKLPRSERDRKGNLTCGCKGEVCLDPEGHAEAVKESLTEAAARIVASNAVTVHIRHEVAQATADLQAQVDAKDARIAEMERVMEAGKIIAGWWSFVQAGQETDGEPRYTGHTVILNYSGNGAGCFVTAEQLEAFCQALSAYAALKAKEPPHAD